MVFVWFEFTFVYDIRWRAYCMRYTTPMRIKWFSWLSVKIFYEQKNVTKALYDTSLTFVLINVTFTLGKMRLNMGASLKVNITCRSIRFVIPTR